jgi:hypothetical protein
LQKIPQGGQHNIEALFKLLAVVWSSERIIHVEYYYLSIPAADSRNKNSGT